MFDWAKLAADWIDGLSGCWKLVHKRLPLAPWNDNIYDKSEIVVCTFGFVQNCNQRAVGDWCGYVDGDF